MSERMNETPSAFPLIVSNPRIVEMPIYRVSFELNSYLHKMLLSFPKVYRETLVIPMKRDSMKIVVLIQEALAHKSLVQKKAALEKVPTLLYHLMIYL